MSAASTETRYRAGPRRFEVAIACSAQRATVIVIGALDATSSQHLEVVVTRLCSDDHPHITLDVAAVTSVHCRAIPALRRAEQHARTAGGELTLAGATALARRLHTLLHPN